MTRRQLLYVATLGVLGFRIALQIAASHAPSSGSPKVWLSAIGLALRENLPLVSVMAISLVLFIAAWFVLLRTKRGTLLDFLSERESAATLLAMAFSWSAPMLLAPGALLGSDWGPQLRASILAVDNLRSFELPVWTFIFGNGTSYTLQYPPLATLVVAGMAIVTHLSPEVCFKLVCAGMHGLFLIGGYRLGRVFGLPRLPSAVAIILISLTQQYWATGVVHGAVPSVIAYSFVPLLLYALVRMFQTGMGLYAAVAGCLLGWIAMAQPIMALFTVYTLVLTVVTILLFRPSLVKSRMWLMLFAGLFTACVAAPYVVSILVFRPYNLFQLSFTQWPSSSVSLLRWLWWSPRVGMPPGVGHDNSGYVGFAIAAANLIAVPIALRQSRQLLSRVYLASLAWGLILVYSPTRIITAIPFGALAKGNYRLWPFLGLALMLGVAITTTWLFAARRYVLASVLILAGVLENAPFNIKPTFHAPNRHGNEVLTGIPAGDRTLTLLAASSDYQPLPYPSTRLPEPAPGTPPGRSWNLDLTEAVEREMSFQRTPTLFYIHHEEQGIVGKRFWELSDLIDQAPPGTDWKQVSKDLKWLRVTHVIVLGRKASDYPGLGSAVSKTIDNTPVTIIAIGPPLPMTHQANIASIQVGPDELLPDGSVRLPLSYHPLLRAERQNEHLTTRSDKGYLSVCCVPSQGAELRITANHPLWLTCLYILSVSSLLGPVALFVAHYRTKGRHYSEGLISVAHKRQHSSAAE